MIGWVSLGVYCLGYLAMWRTIFWAILSDMTCGKPDGDAVCFGIFFTTLVIGPLWPLILLGLGVRAFYLHQGEDAIRALQPRRVRRAADLKAREARIKQLEREPNIR